MTANQAIAFARAQIGKPYVFGATGPDAYDCSGLIQAAAKAGGVTLSRTTYTQVFQGQPVSKANLAPGDLVFPDAGHVQLYSGNGNVIEAPNSRSTVREVPMWGFWQGRRIFDVPGDATVDAQPASLTTDIIAQVTALVTTVASLKAAAEKIDDAFEYITNPALWYRMAVFILGGALLGFALLRMTGLGEAAGKVTGTVTGKVAASVKS